MSRFWYLYNGSGSDLAYGSYIGPFYIPPSCTGGSTSCGIYTPSGGPNPEIGSITFNIAFYLAIAKANSFAFYPLTSTPYVATRS